jgi:hypothetical protein
MFSLFSSNICCTVHQWRCSICDPVLEILDEVHESNLMDSLKDCCDPEKMHNFQSLEHSNKHNQLVFIEIVFIDCSLFLIG